MAVHDTFHPFQRLPTELRTQIWHHALRPALAPALIPFHPNLWTPLGSHDPVVPSAVRHRPPEEHIFCPSVISLSIPLPIVGANKEARAVALCFARQHGLDPIDLGFSRPYDTASDILFVSDHQWHAFAVAANEALFRRGRADVQAIAVHEKFLPGHGGWGMVWKHYPYVRRVYIVCGGTTEPREGRHWELSGVVSGGWWIGNAETEFEFEFRPEEEDSEGLLRREEWNGEKRSRSVFNRVQVMAWYLGSGMDKSSVEECQIVPVKVKEVVGVVRAVGMDVEWSRHEVRNARSCREGMDSNWARGLEDWAER
ncbi:hypothetical protein K461DRAFT_271870 [Myriangium duriaei CBS 260.36]|uniref:2EXR domain-containing protein n=1 Tax=Myriangium duriaei CBS 260.36 TaxID=1168546 RepID=A0A9P4IWW3_9PEZI|nr:hypothetical protein K461DRAFT_271870 [Myriangium duriaei CBS 260.36]